ncbi:DUF4190 domain-containing protein [Leifsonia sp. 22587]|uniref:DUF4190 domain-containing protein n=1 Tax=Leifsonia sp. 22587 TaxID=3453946 RepID=UPI003F837B26
MLDEPTTSPMPGTPAASAAPASEPAYPAAPPKWNVLAIVAFILSFIGGLLGIILGVVSLQKVSRTGERGRGLAISAIVIGAVNIVVGIITWGLVAALVAAAHTSAGSTLERSLPSALTTSAQCQVLADAVTESRTALSDLSTLAADPPKAVSALREFSEEWKTAAATVTDADVRASATAASRSLDALIA